MVDLIALRYTHRNRVPFDKQDDFQLFNIPGVSYLFCTLNMQTVSSLWLLAAVAYANGLTQPHNCVGRHSASYIDGIANAAPV